MSSKLRLILVLTLIGLLSWAMIGTSQAEKNTMRTQVIAHCGSPGWGLRGWWVGMPCPILKYGVYEGLVTQRYDIETKTWSLTKNGLAKDWEHSDDYKTWTFYLRENVKWHDGEEFNAEDVKYTINMWGHPDVMAIRANRIAGPLVGYEAYQNRETDTIEGIEIVDDYTIRFHLTDSRPMYDWWMHMDLSIVPEHIYSEIPMEDIPTSDTWAHPIGTGPFKYVKEKEGEYRILEANEDYWGGKPKVDRWIAYWANNPDSKISRLKADELEATRLESRGVGADLAQSLKKLEEEGYTVRPDYSYLIGYLAIQPKNENITLPVRRAIAHAISREKLKQVLPYIIPLDTFGIGSAKNEDLQEYEYNPEKARQILESVNFKQKETWKIATSYQGSGARRLLEAIAAMLGEVGIRADVAQLDPATLKDQFMQGDEIDLNYDATMLKPWTSVGRYFRPGSVVNPGYDIPGLVTILDNIAELPLGPERDELAKAGQVLINNYLPGLPLFLRAEVHVVAPWFEPGEGNFANHGIHPFGDYRFEEWHFK